MSSAYRRLVIFLPPMLTIPSCSSRASDMIRLRKMLERVSDRRHPCLTPTVVLYHSLMLPFIWTALVTLSKSYSVVRTRFALILYFCMVAHKAACHTPSKAFLKSMKTWFCPSRQLQMSCIFLFFFFFFFLYFQNCPNATNVLVFKMFLHVH